ncbi:ATP-binding protein [Alkalihalobacterium sp. APHAB7]|uniref:ATP-binding protein n=1 Tax=Alkalihalobacterium sp. APHAB7 TaxID=3402081 RepID=UPI003AAC3C68
MENRMREQLVNLNEGWKEKNLGPINDIERLQTIIAQLSHEINNSLTIIKGTLQLYKAETKDQTTNAFIELSESNILKISEVLDEYNFYLGPHSKLEDINLAGMIEELLIEYRHQLDYVDVITYFDRVPVVKGDFNRLRVCFSHIIRNSIEAMSAGGTLRISVVQATSGYKITFEDNGCGMCERELYRFGKPLYYLSSKGKERGQLSLLGFISNYPINISVRSKKGSGTSIEIDYPIHY